MFARRLIPILGLFSVFVAELVAGQKSGAQPGRLSATDCEKLVKQLVNPHKPPESSYVFELRNLSEFQSDPRLRSFQKIGAAYDTLSKNIEVALPTLMKHCNDERYSFVQEQPGSGVYSKTSVGRACCDIVLEHVEVHQRITTGHDDEGRPKLVSFIIQCGGPEKWWQSRKRRSLARLQLEAIEWVLKQKKPHHFKTRKEWQTALTKVKKLADEIRTTKKPIFVDHRFFAY